MARGASMGLSMVLTRRNAREGVAAKGGAVARGLWRVRQSRSLFLPQVDTNVTSDVLFSWNRRRVLLESATNFAADVQSTVLYCCLLPRATDLL